jgi:hypothetical protein
MHSKVRTIFQALTDLRFLEADDSDAQPSKNNLLAFFRYKQI